MMLRREPQRGPLRVRERRPRGVGPLLRPNGRRVLRPLLELGDPPVQLGRGLVDVAGLLVVQVAPRERVGGTPGDIHGRQGELPGFHPIPTSTWELPGIVIPNRSPIQTRS